MISIRTGASRTFLKVFFTVCCMAIVLSAQTRQKPHILYIMTDQQSWNMMSVCQGTKYLTTPTLDSLCMRGVRFNLAYCTNPVCVPSRASLITGQMASHYGVEDNISMPAGYTLDAAQALPAMLRKAGYETYYGGKTHWPFDSAVSKLGLKGIPGGDREALANEAAKFLLSAHTKPFFLGCSFINPHDIGYMALDKELRDIPARDLALGTYSYVPTNQDSKSVAEAARIPAGITFTDFLQTICPPLVYNHPLTKNAADAVIPYPMDGILPSKGRTNNWDDEKWRLNRYAYSRLMHDVDSLIGIILGALKKSGLDTCTVVVFTSDHGFQQGAHFRDAKNLPYDESSRIPFIVSCPWEGRVGAVDSTHLISNGLDLLPTLCDYAGIAPPASCPGMSVRPLTRSVYTGKWREYNFSEIHTGSGAGPVAAYCRMARSNGWKYFVADRGTVREMLFDMVRDSGEMANLAGDIRYAAELNRHRKALLDWCTAIGDTHGLSFLIKPVPVGIGYPDRGIICRAAPAKLVRGESVYDIRGRRMQAVHTGVYFTRTAGGRMIPLLKTR